MRGDEDGGGDGRGSVGGGGQRTNDGKENYKERILFSLIKNVHCIIKILYLENIHKLSSKW